MDIKNILTVDVEDWFHICGIDSIGDYRSWERYEPRIKNNLSYLLNIFAEYNAKGTFFVLGWIAERFPELVEEIEKGGHEIATHGYAHQLVYAQTQKEFADDLKKSLLALSGITKQKILGYRAPSFSITRDSMWALDIIAEQGLQYDSSIFPAARGNGGLLGAASEIHKLNGLWEFPISVMNISFFKVAFAGGGYFRLLPYWLIQRQIKKMNEQGKPIMVYIHPREIDVQQPRLNMPWNRRFKCYVNIQHAESKLRRLLSDFSFTTCRDILDKLKC
jgi:polysaccharide deacetylase family protein (PEP-CTERM system associated)